MKLIGRVTFPTTTSPYVGALLFETFLYGLYAVVFAICACVLLRRKDSRANRIFLVSIVTMFALATSDIIYTYHLLFRKFNETISSFDLRPKYWLYVTNNFLAQTILLYRCYMVWGYEKYVICGPAIFLAAATVCGYVFERSTSMLFEQAWIYLTMTIILNLILIGLTARRIRQEAERTFARHNGTIAFLIGSGLVYSLYIGLDLAFRDNEVGHILLDAGLIQVVGIILTLMIAHVGLGSAAYDIEANRATARHGSIHQTDPLSQPPIRGRSQKPHRVAASVRNSLKLIKESCLPKEAREGGEASTAENAAIGLTLTGSNFPTFESIDLETSAIDFKNTGPAVDLAVASIHNPLTYDIGHPIPCDTSLPHVL